jgi:hypothetical protein
MPNLQACDGVYDVMDNNAVCAHVRKSLAEQADADLDSIAEVRTRSGVCDWSATHADHGLA